MKRKNGFTLVELLAVIVILAIIALIATPTILGVIDKAKMGAAKSSALGYIDAVEKTIAINMLDDSKTNIVDGVYPTADLNDPKYALSVKGNKPETDSWLVIEKNQVVNYSFKIGKYIVSYNSETKTADAVKGDTVNTKPEGGTTEKVVKLTTDVDGNGIADIGDTITIGEENFYVINNDGTTISMLAYYNLNAGGMYDGSTWTAYDNPTYKQDENMKGFVSGQTKKYGTLAFANSNGWTYSNNDTIPTSYYSQYLTDALTNYDTYIKSLGANIESTRLITYNELVNLGCDSSSSSSCSSSGKDWLYSSTYWTGSANGISANRVWYVGSNSYFGDNSYGYASACGARPVLDISVSEI